MKPIAILVSDPHLQENNIELIKNLFSQVEDEAKRLNIKRIFILGDIFQSRKSQPLSVLNAFGDIIKGDGWGGLDIIAIPGNHDKVDYESADSYLDEFAYHPNFYLYREGEGFIIDNIGFVLIPYFKEDTVYSKHLSRVIEISSKTARKNILLTHVAINGVLNNDNIEVDNGLTQNKFKFFDKVFVGHYHNRSKIGDNIHYIGSMCPANFGEDNEKGYTIVYEDGSHEYKTLKFEEYHTIDIDIDRTSQNELEALYDRYKDSEHFIRFKFTGSLEKLKSINTVKYKQVGIDVKIKRSKIDAGVESANNNEFISFDKESIKKEFGVFCKENKLGNTDIGIDYLNKIL